MTMRWFMWLTVSEIPTVNTGWYFNPKHCKNYDVQTQVSFCFGLHPEWPDRLLFWTLVSQHMALVLCCGAFTGSLAEVIGYQEWAFEGYTVLILTYALCFLVYGYMENCWYGFPTELAVPTVTFSPSPKSEIFWAVSQNKYIFIQRFHCCYPNVYWVYKFFIVLLHVSIILFNFSQRSCIYFVKCIPIHPSVFFV